MALISSEASFCLIFVTVVLLYFIIIMALLFHLLTGAVNARSGRYHHRQRVGDGASQGRSDCETRSTLRDLERPADIGSAFGGRAAPP